MSSGRVKRRPFLRRRSLGSDELPGRRFFARAISTGHEGWHSSYDIVGDRAVGSMYDNEGRMVRRNFVVAIACGLFNVDVGTGDGVRISFDHSRRT
jgi:hypothetical protein